MTLATPFAAPAPAAIVAATAVELPPLRRGPLPARDGRLDDLGAVVAATRAGGADLVIDDEHQSDRSQENRQPAPAAGCMSALRARGGALAVELES